MFTPYVLGIMRNRCSCGSMGAAVGVTVVAAMSPVRSEAKK